MLLARISVEDWLIGEHKRSSLLKDRFASLTILGSSFLVVIFVVMLGFRLLLTPSIFVLLVIVSVGTAWSFVRFREERKYGEGIDAFYLSTKFQYEKAIGRKRGG